MTDISKDPAMAWVSIPAAAKEIGISQPTLRAWARRGRFQFDLVDDRMIIRRHELDRLKVALVAELCGGTFAAQIAALSARSA